MLTPSYRQFGHQWPPAIFRNGSLFHTLLFILFLCISCSSVKVPPKKISLFVRDVQSGAPISDFKVSVIDQDGNLIVPEKHTDALGYLELHKKELRNPKASNYNLDQCQVVGVKIVREGSQTNEIRDTLFLNNYHQYYDWYLDRRPISARKAPKLPDSLLVADMHYHVSMRVQNLFGKTLYTLAGIDQGVPENINWYRDYKKLRVLQNGDWKKPYIGAIDTLKLAGSKKWQKRKDRFSALISNHAVRPPKGGASNYLTHYTQATHPHMKQGGVGLAFNAISPFEHGVSNTPGKRMVSNALVTGAPLGWLRRIGWRKHPLTHWENFNLEYQTIRDQNRTLNNFPWRFFDAGMDLRDNIPTVVTVVEGSHMLQDKFFPHEFDYNLENRTERQNKFLFNRCIRGGALLEDTPSKAAFDQLFAVFDTLSSVTPESNVVLSSLRSGKRQAEINKFEWKRLGKTEKDSIGQFVDHLLFYELESNIDSLKRLDGPPVMMVTIAHLTYNGMMGHAPNLDGGKFPTNIVAQKNFNIRVSDDPTYKRQWSGVFFTIPGVNKFGKRVIDQLISTENGHRIFIDLKHSDYSTRKYFFENIMNDSLRTLAPHQGSPILTAISIDNQPTTLAGKANLPLIPSNDYHTAPIPPICSHCCVTGLPNAYSSPLNDDFALLRSPSTTTFNPFGINLFDEEIATICTNDGIIGIPLEQRVLGGYINKKQVKSYRIKPNGEEKKGRAFRNKRWVNVKRLFRHYLKYDSVFIRPAIQYTRDVLMVPELSGDEVLKRYKKILDITQEDYISAAPFLANLFHIIDKSGLDPQAAWDHICIGSDLDGLVDPIDICPTASQYPFFKTRLKQFIPIFLKIRAKNDPSGTARSFEHYFNASFTVDQALNKLFYQSLRNFANEHFVQSLSENTQNN